MHSAFRCRCGPANADVTVQVVPPKPALIEHALPERDAEPLADCKSALTDRSSSSADESVR